MNKHNKLYILPASYNDVLNFDRCYKKYLNTYRCFDYKKDVPKDSPFIMVLKFASDSGDLEYFSRIK